MARPTPPWKLLLFSVIPLGVLMLLATLGLTILEQAGIIHTGRTDDILSFPPPDYLSRITLDGGKVFEIRYAQAGDPLAFRRRFPVQKPEGSYRIILVGGSFALGDPYVDPASASPGFGGIADWMEAEFAMRLRTPHVEVINAALGGTNSTGVVEIVRQMTRTDPDVILVMTGNNDGHVFPSRANRWLNQWVVYRALKKVLLPAPGRRPRFAPQDSDPDTIRANFRANLRELVELAHDHGFQLVLSTMPINYRFTLSDQHNPHDPPRPPPVRGEARTCPTPSTARDGSVPPGDLYAFARCLEQTGRYEEALQAYEAYVEAQPLGRTRPSLNRIAREVAHEQDIVLFDMERLANTASSHGIADPDLFFDNCHLVWRGYAAMARSAVDLLIDQGLLGAVVALPGARPSVEQIIDAQGWEALYSFRPVVIPYQAPEFSPDVLPESLAR